MDGLFDPMCVVKSKGKKIFSTSHKVFLHFLVCIYMYACVCACVDHIFEKVTHLVVGKVLFKKMRNFPYIIKNIRHKYTG